METVAADRAILDAFDEALCILESSGALRSMNRAAERLTGYREGELRGEQFFSRLVAPDADDCEPSLAAFSARERLSLRIRRKDKTTIEIRCEVDPLSGDGDGGSLLKLRPIGGSSKSDALDETKKMLETIFGGMADGLVVINEFGDILLFSKGAEKLFGYRAEESLGRNVKMLMPSPYSDAHDSYLAAYRRTGVKKIIGIGQEVVGRRKNGTTFPMYLSIGEIWLEGTRYFVGVTHDLTRLKRAEDRLLTLSAAVEQSPIAVMITNKHGEIEYVNSRFASLTGYPPHELIGRNPRMLQSKRTEGDQYRRLWESIRAGVEWRGQIQDKRKDGKLYWASEIITPLHNAKGEITHYLAMQQDITEQKRDKEALFESEQRFRQIADMAGDWLWEQDPDGRYTYSSGAVEDVLGMTPEEVVGKSYLDLFAKESAEDAALKTAPSSFALRRAFHRVVNHYRHKNDGDVFTESTGAPIFDEAGRLVKWRGVDHDITSRKTFEDALRVRNRAIEAVPIGIAVWDAQAPRVPNIYVNPALSRITGFTREELLGHSLHLLRGPETDPAALEAIRNAIVHRTSCQVVVKFYRKDGVSFWDELSISPVANEAGRITHFVSVHADISDRRRVEENRHELEIAKQIQLSLLPNAPLRTPHMEIAGICVPATHVGGDYFDYFENSGVVDIVIADVSGHSVGAALIMTEVRSTLRAETRKATNALSGPAELLRDLNELLHEDLTAADLFITMFYCRFLPRTRTLQYANAGQNPPLLLRADGAVCVQLDADGLVLGVVRAVDFKEGSLELAAGDKLLFYTDGITEAQNRQGDFFGLERLSAAFMQHRSLSPRDLIKAVLADVRAFRGQAPASDDVAMVVAQVC
ncbi:PAS domain S-box protein [Methylocystis sp. FS]|uniref:SpoIIE family protein phosphatase n=1 Tax=Methylocystis silviterrae TaxID=2743612 RepID=UPI001583202E|nr:PAS domain S-box protein [Methylocystis silviterrae]NUJ80656.1 PAS domain S-box protein [Methylocystis silviterrae]